MPSRSMPRSPWKRPGLPAAAKAWKLAEDGRLSLNGKLPIMTMGGLKARGNPLGATGVYQVVEAVQQLRGEAGDEPGPGGPPRAGANPGRAGLHRRRPCAGAN